jgi:hypothetical protein
LKNDGTVWAWGDNEDGILGNGTKTDSNVPVQVSEPTGITASTGGEALNNNFDASLASDPKVRAFLADLQLDGLLAARGTGPLLSDAQCDDPYGSDYYRKNAPQAIGLLSECKGDLNGEMAFSVMYKKGAQYPTGLTIRVPFTAANLNWLTDIAERTLGNVQRHRDMGGGLVIMGWTAETRRSSASLMVGKSGKQMLLLILTKEMGG